MKYQNTKTGFVFESDCECHGEGLIKIESSPSNAETEKKPTRKKATKGKEE